MNCHPGTLKEEDKAKYQQYSNYLAITLNRAQIGLGSANKYACSEYGNAVKAKRKIDGKSPLTESDLQRLKRVCASVDEANKITTEALVIEDDRVKLYDLFKTISASRGNANAELAAAASPIALFNTYIALVNATIHSKEAQEATVRGYIDVKQTCIDFDEGLAASEAAIEKTS